MPWWLVKRSCSAAPQQLAAELDALAQARAREHLAQVVDRLDAGEHARARLLDLHLLLREQQEDRVDDQVDELERLDRRAVAGQRRLAHRPRPDVAVERGVLRVEPQVVGGRLELTGRLQERVDVVRALVALREHRDGAARLDAAQRQLAAAHVHERRCGHRPRLPSFPNIIYQLCRTRRPTTSSRRRGTRRGCPTGSCGRRPARRPAAPPGCAPPPRRRPPP